MKEIEEIIHGLMRQFSNDAKELLSQTDLIKPLIKNLIINECIKDIEITTEEERKAIEGFYKSKKLFNQNPSQCRLY